MLSYFRLTQMIKGEIMRIIHTGDLNITEKMDQKTNENVMKFISEVKDSKGDLLIVVPLFTK